MKNDIYKKLEKITELENALIWNNEIIRLLEKQQKMLENLLKLYEE